jgi:CBS domain-containing protein
MNMTDLVEPLTHDDKKNEENWPSDVNALIGIVTDKDIFKAIISNQDYMTEILSDRSFINHKDLLQRLGENLLGESWKRYPDS